MSQACCKGIEDLRQRLERLRDDLIARLDAAEVLNAGFLRVLADVAAVLAVLDQERRPA